ncbi:MAG TPA: GAP family protein [Solirubrobacterales bacterium]|nr:GAP family protein [Solirubrobacterales bacterium]
MLPFAVGIALSPIPIIGVVLMLGTPRARVNGIAFVLGWIFGVAAVGTGLLLLANAAEAAEGSSPAEWVSVAKIALGAFLVVVSVRTWRGRPRRGEEAAMPRWMESVDHFGPGLAAGMAVLLSTINPKNLVLIMGAAAAIAGVGLEPREDAIAMAIFVFIATIGPAAPVAIYFVMRKRSQQILEDLRAWMADNNAAIMAVICLLIGAKLIGDGIGGF